MNHHEWASYWGGKFSALHEVWRDFEQLHWWDSHDPLIIIELAAIERAIPDTAREAWREAQLALSPGRANYKKILD